MTWGVTGVAIAGASLVSGVMGGRAANKAAAEAADEQAKLTFARRQEEIRMKVAQAKQVKGTAVAQVYSSNLQMSGSSKRYFGALNTENMREIAYAKDAALKERDAIKKGAGGAGASLFANAGQQLGAIAGSLAAMYTPSTAAPTLGNVSGHTAQAMSPGLGGSGMTHSGFGSVTPTSTNAGAG